MSSSAADHWQACRLRRETVKRLQSLIPGFERGRELGINRNYDGPGEQGYSVDLVVQILLDREERKRARSKRKRLVRGESRGPLPLVVDPLEGELFGG